MKRTDHIYEAMERIGSTLARVEELACLVRQVTVEDSRLEAGFRPSDCNPLTCYHAVNKLTNDQLDELVGLIRLEPFDQEQVNKYKADAERWERQQAVDRRAAARFTLEDPHLQAQREGWGL